MSIDEIKEKFNNNLKNNNKNKKEIFFIKIFKKLKKYFSEIFSIFFFLLPNDYKENQNLQIENNKLKCYLDHKSSCDQKCVLYHKGEYELSYVIYDLDNNLVKGRCIIAAIKAMREKDKDNKEKQAIREYIKSLNRDKESNAKMERIIRKVVSEIERVK